MKRQNKSALPVVRGSEAPEIRLLDELTGRIEIAAGRASGKVTGQWELLIDGALRSSGRFVIDSLAAGEVREFLFSPEVPDLPPASRAALSVRLEDAGGRTISAGEFPLPPTARTGMFEKRELFRGVRFDVSQAFISSGKLSAVIDADGLRELRGNGDLLMTSGSRPALWRTGMIPEHLRDLRLERMKIFPDRFASDGESVECHCLAMPGRMDLDELEYTQRFTPLDDGSIRFDAEFTVPESFSGLPRLGTEFRLPETLSPVGGLTCGSPDGGEIISGHDLRELAFSDSASGKFLHIYAGYKFGFRLMPFPESAVAEAERSGQAPEPESVKYLYIDCKDAQYTSMVRSGRYRMALFFRSDIR